MLCLCARVSRQTAAQPSSKWPESGPRRPQGKAEEFGRRDHHFSGNVTEWGQLSSSMFGPFSPAGCRWWMNFLSASRLCHRSTLTLSLRLHLSSAMVSCTKRSLRCFYWQNWVIHPLDRVSWSLAYLSRACRGKSFTHVHLSPSSTS